MNTKENMTCPHCNQKFVIVTRTEKKKEKLIAIIETERVSGHDRSKEYSLVSSIDIGYSGDINWNIIKSDSSKDIITRWAKLYQLVGYKLIKV